MEAKLQALKVPDLKKLLQDASLPVSGTKSELIKRLLESPEATSSLGGGDELEEDLLEETKAEAPPMEALKEQPAKSTPATQRVVPVAKKEESSTPAAAPATKSEEDQKAALVAELEKRKARAARWGLSTGEAEAKLERAIKFGIETSQDKTLSSLDGGLKGGKRREDKAEKKGPVAAAGTASKKDEVKVPVSKPAETEEEKAARLARQEMDEAAKKKRAERFGLQAPVTATTTNKSPSVDPAEEEKKRKRMEKFATTPSAEPADKKIKA